jgi:hypothetical protein
MNINIRSALLAALFVVPAFTGTTMRANNGAAANPSESSWASQVPQSVTLMSLLFGGYLIWRFAPTVRKILAERSPRKRAAHIDALRATIPQVYKKDRKRLKDWFGIGKLFSKPIRMD